MTAKSYPVQRHVPVTFNIDDLGVITMGKRFSIQQGEKDNCWLSNVLEKKIYCIDWSVFRGPPGIVYSIDLSLYSTVYNLLYTVQYIKYI